MLFINTHNRDHDAIFGPGAFFDLDIKGYQATLAKTLRQGQQCVVASYEGPGRKRVRLSTYEYKETRFLLDNEGQPNRTLFGELTDSVVMTKQQASEDPRYSAMFDVRGNFKQRSVIES